MTVLEPTRPDVRSRAAARRAAPRHRGGVALLPPWTRAPWLSFGQPAVIFAVLGAAAILACASASAALFLSSAASESLRVQIAAECDDATYPQLEQTLLPFDPTATGAATDAEVRSAMAAQGLADPYRVQFTAGTASVNSATQSTLGRIFYRDNALDNIALVAGSTTGTGFVVPEFTAQRLSVVPGDTLTIAGYSAPVVGVYTDLFREQIPREFWCSYGALYLNEASLDPPPPALILTTGTDVVDGVEARLGESFQTTLVTRTWISPIDTENMTLSRAREIDAQRAAAFDESTITNRFDRTGEQGLLPEMIGRTSLLIDGLRGPVIPIAIGGSVLALLLVAAAGSYWADRRVREVRLLSSRGVGPVALAGKAALELVIPATVGTALGWLLSQWLIRSIGPSPALDPEAPAQAAITAGAGLVLGMVLLSAVAGLRARGATETTIGARRSWIGLVPWEFVLLTAALLSWLRLRSQEGVVIENNVAQVNLLLVSFPLLFLAGAAVLCVRLLAATLPLVRRRARRWRPAAYLAASRVASSRLISAGLLATVSMPLGVLAYSATLTATTAYTLQTKAAVVVGSDVAVISVDEIPSSPALDDVGTIVSRYPYAGIDGQDVSVLAIDPRTFARYAYWDDRFAEQSLDDLLAALQADDGSPGVNAIVMGFDDATATVSVGQRDIEMDVVAQAEVLPGRRQVDPLFVVLADELGAIDRSAGRFSEVWSTFDQTAVRTALPEEVRVLRVQDTATVFRVANFLSVSWTFGYLQALAAFVGAVAIGGLLLYLETRQRSRVASYALARRMGLKPGSHLRSLIIELGVLLGLAFVVGTALAGAAVLTVYRLLELDPNRPPGPLLTLPVITVLAALAATAVVALLAAAYAQRAATRAGVAEVLRLGS